MSSRPGTAPISTTTFGLGSSMPPIGGGASSSLPGTPGSTFPRRPQTSASMGSIASHKSRNPWDHLRPLDTVGLDTFRGTGMNSTASRMSLYSKNGGDVRVDNTGVVMRVESPVSGDLLITPVAKNRPGVKDPVAGTPMRYHGGTALLQTPATNNQFLRTRKFYITKDVDITIQTLRNTTKVNRFTNEKVGTAGTPTGMDPALLFYQGCR
ncbi:hypothetical protein HYH03_014380 [Edaphochlamys debaryana]|uniref:Uncharacterized protein n=1 Tax=Edaphochlamys debaryana TaxID=47281 RepID=A0A835XWC9_9CHLO|nr:hypothetical protein HYH03_014380 [Edaphochlamys debaryana]|eukprot:KAG2487009.1 hypothetical protein HYH03_014380 [Edaphochlamys debaryana]